MNKHVNSHLRIQSLIRIVSVVLRHWASAYFSVIVHSWTLQMDERAGIVPQLGHLLLLYWDRGPCRMFSKYYHTKRKLY